MKMYMGHGGKALPHITYQTANAGGGGGGHKSHSLEIALSYPMPHSLLDTMQRENFYCHQESNPSSSDRQFIV